MYERVRRPFGLLLLLLCATTAIVAGCGGQGAEDVRSGAPAVSGSGEGGPARPDGSAEPTNMDELWAEHLGVPVGARTLVGPDDGSDRVGYVNWEYMYGRRPDTPAVGPVFAEAGQSSESGTIIAYWGNGIGWIEKEDYLDPSFDFDAVYAERHKNDPPSELPAG